MYFFLPLNIKNFRVDNGDFMGMLFCYVLSVEHIKFFRDKMAQRNDIKMLPDDLVTIRQILRRCFDGFLKIHKNTLKNVTNEQDSSRKQPNN